MILWRFNLILTCNLLVCVSFACLHVICLFACHLLVCMLLTCLHVICLFVCYLLVCMSFACLYVICLFACYLLVVVLFDFTNFCSTLDPSSVQVTELTEYQGRSQYISMPDEHVTNEKTRIEQVINTQTSQQAMRKCHSRLPL